MNQTTCDTPKVHASPGIRNVPEGTLSIAVYNDFDDIASLQKEWDDFIESEAGEIFLTFDWCRLWWKYYGMGRELAIFIVREDGKIGAIVPLFRETINLGPLRLKAVKLVGSDYMPVTASVAIEGSRMDRIVSGLLPRLQQFWDWDLLFLGPLCGRYEQAEDLAKAVLGALGSSYRCDRSTNDVQTYFTVAPDWDGQIASLVSKQRTNLRRTFREVEKRSVSIVASLADAGTCGAMFDDFVAMHQTHWQKIGKPGHFVAWPAAREFHREAAGAQLAHDRLRLIAIQMNGHIVGYEYLYRCNDTYAWFLNARDHSKSLDSLDYKWVAFRARADFARKDGVTCIDGLRGKYDYKLEMGGKLLPVTNLFVYRSDSASRLRVLIFRRAARWLHIGYYKLWRARIAPRLGIRLKSFWSKWIRLYLLAD